MTQWPSPLKRRSQFSFASLLNGRTWTQIRTPLGIFYTLILDSRSQLGDSMQLGLGPGLGKAGSKFQKGWPSRDKQPPESFGQNSFND